MFSYRVSLGPPSDGVDVLVESEWELVHWPDWLEPYGSIESYGGSEPASGSEPARYLIGSDVGSCGELGDEAEPVALHGGSIGIRTPGDKGVDIASLGRPALYHVGRTAVALNYPDDADYWELDAFQIIRGVVQAAAERAGRRRFHGAAVDRKGTGLVFVGDTGAGKTSFMLSLLRTGAYGYVGNDKLHLDRAGGISGLPMAAAIAVESLPELPRLEVEPTSRVIDGKLLIWPGDLARALGVECTPRTSLGAVFSCELDLTRSDVSVTPLPAAERAELIAGPVSVFTDGVQPLWLLAELGIAPVPPGLPPDAADVPWFQVAGNPWSADWPVAVETALSRPR